MADDGGPATDPQALDPQQNGSETRDEADPSNGSEEEQGADRAPSAANRTEDASTRNESWQREANLSLGARASAGVEAFAAPLPGGGPIEDRTVEGCLAGRIGVPQGTGELAIAVEDEAIDPDRPGAGGYSLAIQDPSGETIYLDWTIAATIDPEQFAHAIEDPLPGDWSLELDPNGATFGQWWRFHVEMEGVSASPPDAIATEPSCT